MLYRMSATPTPRNTPRRLPTRYKLLLLLPYFGLLFPQLYARSTPSMWGFPFFYWYQFAWVLLASLLMALAYRFLRS
jgi:hypothetical protein